MATVEVVCRYCAKKDDVVKRGRSTSGKQRYQCRLCNRYFQFDYVYNACKPGVKEQIVEMAMSGAGIRDTVRMLKVGINTVIGTLKKTDAQNNKYVTGNTARNYSPC